MASVIRIAWHVCFAMLGRWMLLLGLLVAAIFALLGILMLACIVPCLLLVIEGSLELTD